MPDATSPVWRLLVLDREPDDPKWLIATVTLSADVRPARLDQAGRYTDWEDVARWVAASLGHQVQLIPAFDPLVWTVTQ